MTKQLQAFQAQIFWALAHPTRIAIVDALRHGSVTATALLGQLQVEASQVSTHLTVLRDQQVVEVHTQGNYVYYSLSDPLLLQAMDTITQSFYRRLGQSQASRTSDDAEP